VSTLIAGLFLFLGVHSARIFAEGWRQRVIASRGPNAWKGVYSVASILGFVLIIVGFGQARQAPIVLWSPPHWTHHVAGLLTLAAFVLVVAAYVPGNAIKARLQDPMILGVKSWALGHLIANGTLADVVLFGSFLVWAVLDFRAARQRRASGGAEPVTVRSGRTGVTVLIGIVAWIVFAFWLHARWIGVSPFEVQPFA
jgi:uncharacterized membrane protein